MIIQRAVLSTVVAAVIFGSLTSNAYASTVTNISSSPAAMPTSMLHVPDVKSAVAESKKKMAQAVDSAKKVMQGADAAISTAKLDEMKKDVVLAQNAAEKPLPHEVALDALGNPSSMKQAKAYIRDVNIESEKRATALVSAISAWQAEVDAEKVRLEAAKQAEEARKAAAAAKAQEEAAAAKQKAAEAVPSTDTGRPTASNPQGTQAAPAAQPAPTETSQARVNRIAASLGFINIPVVIQDGCAQFSNAIGCYAFDGTIHITSYGLTKSDCTLRVAIAHEWKHSQQDVNGQIQFDANGNITNRDWLEADAGAFGYAHGC